MATAEMRELLDDKKDKKISKSFTIRKSIFEKLEKVSKREKIARSKLADLALEKFLNDYESLV